MWKFLWRFKEPKIAKTIMKKNNKVGRLSLLDFKTYYKTTVNQDYTCTGKKKDIEINGIELTAQENPPHL